jgi:hypothetical protein
MGGGPAKQLLRQILSVASGPAIQAIMVRAVRSGGAARESAKSQVPGLAVAKPLDRMMSAQPIGVSNGTCPLCDSTCVRIVQGWRVMKVNTDGVLAGG